MHGCKISHRAPHTPAPILPATTIRTLLQSSTGLEKQQNLFFCSHCHHYVEQFQINSFLTLVPPRNIVLSTVLCSCLYFVMLCLFICSFLSLSKTNFCFLWQTINVLFLSIYLSYWEYTSPSLKVLIESRFLLFFFVLFHHVSVPFQEHLCWRWEMCESLNSVTASPWTSQRAKSS